MKLFTGLFFPNPERTEREENHPVNGVSEGPESEAGRGDELWGGKVFGGKEFNEQEPLTVSGLFLIFTWKVVNGLRILILIYTV